MSKTDVTPSLFKSHFHDDDNFSNTAFKILPFE